MTMSRRIHPAEATQVAPGRVTAITGSPRAAGRFDVEIDGRPTLRLSIDGIERLKIRVGTSVDELLAAKLGREADVMRAYDRAMAMLAVRGRAAGELRRLLIQKGEPSDLVSESITRLVAAGFLDDAAFARQFARSRAASGWSRRRIDRELGRRGVDRGTTSEAIAEVFAEEGIDDRDTILREAQKKLRMLGRVDEVTRRRRLYGYLARRGYDADAIGEVLRSLTTDETN